MNTYQWFMLPLNKLTNDALARELDESQSLTRSLVTTESERLRACWQCPYWLVTYFQRSKATEDYRFRVFKRPGNKGPVTEWFFHKKLTQPKRTAQPA